jgi:isorenieratene synthase
MFKLPSIKPYDMPVEGRRDRVDGGLTVAIIGGGLAGCAAAAVLAERGVSVTLYEKEPVLGGRVSAWDDQLEDGESFQMERGFHAFFRNYYNLRGLMRRWDPTLSALEPVPDYPIIGPKGDWESFAGLPKTTPFNLIALVKRTPTLTLRDLMKIPTWPTLELLAYDQTRTFERYDHMSAGALLDALNFPDDARQLLFDVFAHSFFNPQYDMSAAEMIKMFHLYFTGNPEGLLFDVLNRPFSEAIWKPLTRYLTEHGVEIKLNTPVTKVRRKGHGWRVSCRNRRAGCDADAVILATAVPGLKRIVSASEDLGTGPWKAAIGALEVTQPFVVWRLWLDRPAQPDRPAFAGTAGLGLLDNISLYEQIEDESRAWSKRTGGAVVELHGYALPNGLTEPNIREDLWTNLVAAYPEFKDATPRHERFLIRQDCPRFAPGDDAQRPGVETPHSNIFLAGDFVKLPVPSALMEAAVTSGYLAANKVLAQRDVKGEAIRSVPLRGIFTSIARRLNRNDRFAARA